METNYAAIRLFYNQTFKQDMANIGFDDAMKELQRSIGFDKCEVGLKEANKIVKQGLAAYKKAGGIL